jgi:hypothetical protein
VKRKNQKGKLPTVYSLIIFTESGHVCYSSVQFIYRFWFLCHKFDSIRRKYVQYFYL